MHSLDVLFIFFISTTWLLDPCFCLDYTDIETLGLVNCRSHLNCVSKNNRSTSRIKSCMCDAACAAYDDCCIDAKQANRRRQRPRPSSSRRTCLVYGDYTREGVYVVSSCARGWNGPEELRLKCLQSQDLRDPMNAAPLTSVTQGRTYRNRYCAECNGALSAELLTWHIRVDCKNLPLNVSNSNVWPGFKWNYNVRERANIEWNDNVREWGVYGWSSTGDKMFYSCSLTFDLPQPATKSVRFCHANTISSCGTSWNRPAVQRACESYTGVVYSGDNVYRNPHCALCNGLVVDQISCKESFTARNLSYENSPTARDRYLFHELSPTIPYRNSSSERSAARDDGNRSYALYFSFALFWDVIQSDGDQVGVSRQPTPRCPANQIYDPFFKWCRALFCALPGYKLENERCVPE